MSSSHMVALARAIEKANSLKGKTQPVHINERERQALPDSTPVIDDGGTGVRGDKYLANVTRPQMEFLHDIMGGSGRINPNTGLAGFDYGYGGGGWGYGAGGEGDGDGASDGWVNGPAYSDEGLGDGTEGGGGGEGPAGPSDGIGSFNDFSAWLGDLDEKEDGDGTNKDNAAATAAWKAEAAAARAAGKLGGVDADAISGMGAVTPGGLTNGQQWGTVDDGINTDVVTDIFGGPDQKWSSDAARGMIGSLGGKQAGLFGRSELDDLNAIEEAGIPTYGLGLRGFDELNGLSALTRGEYFGEDPDSIKGGALDAYMKGEYGRPGDFIEGLIGLGKFAIPGGNLLSGGGHWMNQAKSDLYANTDDPRGMNAWDRTFAQAQDAQARQAADDYRASQMGIGESFSALGRFGERMGASAGKAATSAWDNITGPISDFLNTDSTKTGSLQSILSGKDEDEELTEEELSTIMVEAGVRGRSDPSVELAEGLGKTGLGTIAGTHAGYDFGKGIWGDRNAVTQGLNSFLSYLGSAGGDAYEGLIQAGVADPTTFNINGQDVTVGPDTISSGGVTLDVTDTGVSWSPFRGEGDEEEKKAEGGIVQGQQGGGLETLHDNINRGRVIDYSRTNPQESSVVSLDKPSYNNSIQSHYLSGY